MGPRHTSDRITPVSFAAARTEPSATPGGEGRQRRGAIVGAVGGLVVGSAVGAHYVHRFGTYERLDWASLAMQFFLYATASGALLGWSLARAGATVRASVAAGARGAILPGALACGHFGTMRAPFVGAGALGCATLAIVVVLTWHAVREDGRSFRSACYACVVAIAPTAIVAATIGLVASRLGGPPIDAELIIAAYDALRVRGLVVLAFYALGAVCGAAAGSLVGAHVALARLAGRKQHAG
jgi:hypothetical protein